MLLKEQQHQNDQFHRACVHCNPRCDSFQYRTIVMDPTSDPNLHHDSDNSIACIRHPIPILTTSEIQKSDYRINPRSKISLYRTIRQLVRTHPRSHISYFRLQFLDFRSDTSDNHESCMSDTFRHQRCRMLMNIANYTYLTLKLYSWQVWVLQV